MKITREADYAIRILCILKNTDGVISARDISEKAGVSLRFSLKILSKLTLSDLVDSKKGSLGGYFLKKNPSEISFADIIQCIDGDIAISHCLADGFCCTRVSDKSTCDYRKIFDELSEKIRKELDSVKLSQF